MPVDLLSIGLDGSIGLGKESHYRQQRYASVLNSYRIIARTLGTGERVRNYAGWTVYPTNSQSRARFVLDAYQVGCQLCQEKLPGVVSAQGPFLSGLVVYLLSKRFGVPFSLQYAGDEVGNPYWLSERPYNRGLDLLARWLIPRADSHRVVSIAQKRRLMRAYGIPARKIWVLGWITDASRFDNVDKTAARNWWLWGSREQLVTFIGRMVKQKDLPTLIRAIPFVLTTYPNARFLIVGNGPERERVLHQVKRMGLNRGPYNVARFPGALPYEQIPEILAASDLLVLPSRYEGLARVMVEAMLSGVPVVSTEVSGARDAIQEGVTGRIVPVGDHRALAGAICDVLRNPQRAKAMGAAGRQRALKLVNEDAILAGFRDLWETTASRGKTGDRP